MDQEADDSSKPKPKAPAKEGTYRVRFKTTKGDFVIEVQEAWSPLAAARFKELVEKKFFDENGIDNLPRHQDPKQAVAREMGVIGLPITVIIDPDGNEIARLIGDAEWNSDSAKAIISTLVEGNS